MSRSFATRLAALEDTWRPVATIEEALDAAEALAEAQEEGADARTLEACERNYAEGLARAPAVLRALDAAESRDSEGLVNDNTPSMVAERWWRADALAQGSRH